MWEIPKEKDHLKDQDVDGKLELELILGILVGGLWIGFSWIRIGTVGGLL
jgi:hypothetical protein